LDLNNIESVSVYLSDRENYGFDTNIGRFQRGLRTHGSPAGKLLQGFESYARKLYIHTHTHTHRQTHTHTHTYIHIHTLAPTRNKVFHAVGEELWWLLATPLPNYCFHLCVTTVVLALKVILKLTKTQKSQGARSVL